MARFLLRGKSKVNVQWLLYCVVHNLEKWAKTAGAEPCASIFIHILPKSALMSLRILIGSPLSLLESRQSELA